MEDITPVVVRAAGVGSMIRLVLSIAAVFVGFLSSFAQESQQKQVLDKRDLVTKEWITEVGTNLKFLDHETIYSSDGKKIQETEYSKLGKVWTKKYEYGPDGKTTRELTYNDKGRLDSIQKFEYNEFGKKKTVYTYSAKGKLVKIKVIDYILRDHVD